jgi:hypothetical protein
MSMNKKTTQAFGDALRERQVEKSGDFSKNLEFFPYSVGYQDVATLIKKTLAGATGPWWDSYIGRGYTKTLSEQSTEDLENVAGGVLESFQELDAKSLGDTAASFGEKIVNFFSTPFFEQASATVDDFHLSKSYIGGIDNKNIAGIKNTLLAYGYSEDNSRYSTSSEIASTFTGLVNPTRTDSNWDRGVQAYVKAHKASVESLDALFESCYNLESGEISGKYTIAVQCLTDMRAALVELEQTYVQYIVDEFNKLYADYQYSIPDDYMYVAYGREPVEAARAESNRDRNRCVSDHISRMKSASGVARKHYEDAVRNVNKSNSKTISAYNSQYKDYVGFTPLDPKDYHVNVDINVENSIKSAYNSMLGAADAPCAALGSAMYTYYIQRYQKSGLWGVAERNVIRSLGGDSIYTDMTKAAARPLLEAENLRLLSLLNKTRNDATEVQDYVTFDFPDNIDLINECYVSALNTTGVMVSGAIETQLYTRGESYNKKTRHDAWSETVQNTEGDNPVVEELRGYYTVAQSDFLSQLRELGDKYAGISRRRADMDVSYDSYDELNSGLENIEKTVDFNVGSIMTPNSMNIEIWGAFE